MVTIGSEPAKQKNFLQRFFRRKSVDLAVAPRQLSLQVVESGSSGTELYSGYFQEEYLPELTGQLAAKVYDKMRRSDADAKMVVNAVKGSIMGASWEVEAAGNTSKYEEHKAFIEHVLFKDQQKDWDEIVGEGATMVEFGHAVFEITHKAVLNHRTFGSYVGLAKLGWRSPKTIERWNLAPDGSLSSITQYAYGDLDRRVDIPGEFLLPMAIEKEGDNYEGVSLLRAAYGAWWRKQLYLKLMAIGSEKHAVPPPILEIPSGKQGTDQETEAKRALEAYCSNESNYLTIPQGWKLDFMKNPFDPEKLKLCLEYEGTQIARSSLMQFLLLGSSGSSGSWALSTDLSDFALNAIVYVADRFRAPFNKKLIPQLIKLNYGEQDAYPELKHSGISDKAGKELAEVLTGFIDSGAVEADLDLETHLRKRYGLPKKGTNDVRKKVAEPGKEDAPTSPPPKPARTKKALSDKNRREQLADLPDSEKVIFIAKGSNQCEKCQALDGKIYDSDDPDLPVLPIHPNCECEYEAYRE